MNNEGPPVFAIAVVALVLGCGPGESADGRAARINATVAARQQYDQSQGPKDGYASVYGEPALDSDLAMN